jgi:predicted PurR-regulated permease PerM
MWLERKGLKRVWAIILLYAFVVVSTTLLLWFTIPKLILELSSVAAILPQYADKLEQFLDHINGIEWPGKMDQIIEQDTYKFENLIYTTLQGFISVLFAVLSKALVIIFAPILAFYIIKDWEKIKAAFLNILPPVTRREIGVLAKQIDSVITEFLKGYLMIAAMIGVLVGIAAALIGVRYALLIGIISGITELIPYFGPFLGGIPAVGLALSQSPYAAVYMTLSIIFLQQIECNIITPKIIGERVGMHPLLMVFALLAGGQLMGIWGMLIAVPLAASIKIIGTYIYLKIVEP